MSSPARKKRKTGAASEGGTAGILSIEMIGKVASFANYGDDLMNICKAVGRKDSAVIRYTCLRNNYRYLQLSVERNIRAIATDKKTGSDVRDWMAINTDWRDKRITNACREISVQVVNEVNFKQHGGRRAYTCSAAAIFHNPAVAIGFGLVEILRNIVENTDIDVNATVWNNYSTSDKYHLLFLALHDDRACFDYLISTKKIDMNSRVMSGGNYKTLKMFVMEADDIQKEQFQAMVRLPTFGLNDPIDIDGRSLLPLVYMAMSASTSKTAPLSDDHLAKIQILLDAGADPTCEADGGDYPSPLSFITHVAAITETTDHPQHSEHERWKKILQMMKPSMEQAVE